MTIKFFPNDKGNPPGKLADAELHFAGGPLDGLKLVGFAVWERKTGGRNVTFPARQYSVNGERRSFALLRPSADTASQDTLRDIILEAYKEHEAELAAAVCLPPGSSETPPYFEDDAVVTMAAKSVSLWRWRLGGNVHSARSLFSSSERRKAVLKPPSIICQGRKGSCVRSR